MNALSIKNLTKIYSNGTRAVENIDFLVESGDFYALLGPNGAGKTTIIGIISSLVNKTSGKVKIFDHDIDKNFSAAKALIGVVPQEININQFDTPFNIVINQAGYYGINRALAKKRAEKYLNELRLWDRRNQRARNLSGGMKRRLMIARALIHEPKLLLLDEPTAGVDVEIRRSMWEFLRYINANGTTIILTTHYLEEAENLCKRVAIIDGGSIIENTQMNTILKKLKREVFILTLQDSIEDSPFVEGYDISFVEKDQLEVVVDSKQELNQLFVALKDQNIRVTSIRNRSNRLEELFMELVDSKQKESIERAL
tara:strand:- start:6741 stop:7679 length:939 start_codon:yes stop_codon:yes gene_type:complete